MITSDLAIVVSVGVIALAAALYVLTKIFFSKRVIFTLISQYQQ
jgi:hypothetical protein